MSALTKGLIIFYCTFKFLLKNKMKNKKFLLLLLKGLAIGIVSGLIVGFYRLVIEHAEGYSYLIYAYVKNNIFAFLLWVVALIVLALIVGFFVSKNSMISGSGIPQIKGIVYGKLKNNWLSTIILKFVGGVLSIFAGLSLGREGPCIQISASVAEGFNKKHNVENADTIKEKNALVCVGAAAGMASAFSAPITGVFFVFEEIIKRYSFNNVRLLVLLIIATFSADFVVSFCFNMQPAFSFVVKDSIGISSYPLLVLLGVVLGCLGAFYNFVLVNITKWYQNIKCFSAVTRPILPFLFAGFMGIFLPLAICSGKLAIDSLTLTFSVYFLLLILVAKFCFSVVSFASGVPGGILFPLLAIGAILGALFGKIFIFSFGLSEVLFYNFIIFAMAGFFTAIVRAPLTGIFLLVEMTGSWVQILPIATVSIVSFYTANLLKSEPVYGSLLDMILNEKHTPHIKL
jgi:H+/Cl- antiporter ClcA